MLFEPDRHQEIVASTWDAARAQAALLRIVHDIERQRSADGGWPVHPQDEDGPTPASGFKSLYLGSAGVHWALAFLQREGAVALNGDPVAGLQQSLDAYRADPDTGSVVPSYYLGEAGILLLLWRVTGAREVADRLFGVVQSNIDNPTNEALWAAPGTMVAAWHLWQATQEQRWRSLFLDNVERLWRTWLFDDAAQCHLWTQDLYGSVVQYLGAGHGFAGNVYPLLRAAALLDAERRGALYQRCVTTLGAMARREGDAINWPPGTFAPRPGRPECLMQWCHGSPGIVTALADFPAQHSPAMDEMLLAAGQAVWQAGPLAKGAGLCHGTAGNGCAFLVLYRRSGDAMWLDRARAFAMHAIEQSELARAQHGQGRYTLWTGDAGLAVYLWQCLQGRPGMAALDFL
jgi:hypothetical protein